MIKYIDTNYCCYNSISDCLKNEQSNKLELKQLIYQKTQLLIVDKISENILMRFEDIQLLYLYPLTILDYCKLLLEKEISLFSTTKSINIIKFDNDRDYINKFCKLNLKALSNVEIEINKKQTEDELRGIIEFLNYLTYRNIKITLLFKTIDISDELLIKLSTMCDFFKIMLPDILNMSLFNKFKNKLEIVCINRKESSVVLIKSYLDVNQNNYYEQFVKAFDKLNIDIFQLSKKLIPNNKMINPLIPKNIQNNIRYLEEKYSNMKNTRFISVKDISTLYYPRFELDERNSRKCYACSMKPYLFSEKFLPCKVDKILSNLDTFYMANLDSTINPKNIYKWGIECDDCASIFENDILGKIETIISGYEGKNIEFILEMGENEC